MRNEKEDTVSVFVDPVLFSGLFPTVGLVGDELFGVRFYVRN